MSNYLHTSMQLLYLTALLAMMNVPDSAAVCDGFDQLRLALNTNQGGLADELIACVAPLLFTPMHWLPTNQAHDFCQQEACQSAVHQLKLFPSCMWESQVPSTSDTSTLAIAQQVMRDCVAST